MLLKSAETQQALTKATTKNRGNLNAYKSQRAV
jgi:hypothetical protein